MAFVTEIDRTITVKKEQPGPKRREEVRARAGSFGGKSRALARCLWIPWGCDPGRGGPGEARAFAAGVDVGCRSAWFELGSCPRALSLPSAPTHHYPQPSSWYAGKIGPSAPKRRLAFSFAIASGLFRREQRGGGKRKPPALASTVMLSVIFLNLFLKNKETFP